MYPKIYEITEHDSFLAKWIFSLLGENPFFHSVLSALLVYGIAVILGLLSNKYRFFRKPNLYVSYFFVLLSSLIAEVQILSPVLIGLVFFILYLRSSLMIYRYHLKNFEIFNIGFFAMLSGLIYPPFMMLLFASFFVVLFFEGSDVKAFLLLILGMIGAALIIFPIFFFFGFEMGYEKEVLGLSEAIFDPTYWTFDRIMYSVIIITLVLFGISRYFSILKKKIIDARKRITFLVLITGMMLIIPFFFVGTEIYTLLILSLMGAFLLALYFDSIQNIIAVEILHLLLIIFLFGFQFNLIII